MNFDYDNFGPMFSALAQPTAATTTMFSGSVPAVQFGKVQDTFHPFYQPITQQITFQPLVGGTTAGRGVGPSPARLIDVTA